MSWSDLKEDWDSLMELLVIAESVENTIQLCSDEENTTWATGHYAVKQLYLWPCYCTCAQKLLWWLINTMNACLYLHFTEYCHYPKSSEFWSEFHVLHSFIISHWGSSLCFCFQVSVMVETRLIWTFGPFSRPCLHEVPVTWLDPALCIHSQR